MNKVLQSEILCNNPIVFDFLSFPDSKQFTKTLKGAIAKEKTPVHPQQFFTPTGTIHISNEEKYFKFGEKYETYASSYEVLTTKFHQLSKRLVEEMS